MNVNFLHLPWLEFAIAVSLIGSPLVSRLREPSRAFRWGLLLTGLSFGSALLAWVGFVAGVPGELTRRYSVQPALFGRQIFGLDELSAPLVPTFTLTIPQSEPAADVNRSASRMSRVNATFCCASFS